MVQGYFLNGAEGGGGGWGVGGALFLFNFFGV